jgi:hypothetical protein
MRSPGAPARAECDRTGPRRRDPAFRHHEEGLPRLEILSAAGGGAAAGEHSASGQKVSPLHSSSSQPGRLTSRKAQSCTPAFAVNNFIVHWASVRGSGTTDIPCDHGTSTAFPTSLAVGNYDNRCDVRVWVYDPPGGVHSRGSVIWCQAVAGSGGSQGFPSPLGPYPARVPGAAGRQSGLWSSHLITLRLPELRPRGGPSSSGKDDCLATPGDPEASRPCACAGVTQPCSWLRSTMQKRLPSGSASTTKSGSSG